jgi:hypothetical protein
MSAGSMSGSMGSVLSTRVGASAAAPAAVGVKGRKKVSWLDKVSVVVLDAASRVLIGPDPTSAELLDPRPSPYNYHVTQCGANPAVSFNDIVFCTYDAIDAGLASTTMPKVIVAIIKEYSIEVFARIHRNVSSRYSSHLDYENALEREDFRGAALGIRHLGPINSYYGDSMPDYASGYYLDNRTEWSSSFKDFRRCVGKMKDLLQKGKVRAANFLFTQLISMYPDEENCSWDFALGREYGKGRFSFSADFYHFLLTAEVITNRQMYLDGVKIIFSAAPGSYAARRLFDDAMDQQDIDVIRMGVQYEANNDRIRDVFVEALRNRDVPLIQRFIELNVFNNAWMSHQPLLDQISSVMADGRKDIVSLFPPIAIATVFNNPRFSEALFLFGFPNKKINRENIMFVLSHLSPPAQKNYINYHYLNQTFLALAVSSSEYEMAKWLFENGASFNLSYIYKNNPHEKLLTIAIENGKPEMVSLLLRNGSDVQAAEKWKEALSKACLAESEDDKLNYNAMLLCFVNYVNKEDRDFIKEHVGKADRQIRIAHGAQDSKSNEA